MAPRIEPRKFNSREICMPPNGPWMTWNEVREIEKRVNKEVRVFEWGAGSSTRWFADRAKWVTSVERSVMWVKKVQKQLGARKNVWIEYLGSKEDYVDALRRNEPTKFGLILIDGDWRTDCAEQVSILLREHPDWNPIVYVHDYGFLPGIGQPDASFMGAEKFMAHVDQVDSLARFERCPS